MGRHIGLVAGQERTLLRAHLGRFPAAHDAWTTFGHLVGCTRHIIPTLGGAVRACRIGGVVRAHLVGVRLGHYTIIAPPIAPPRAAVRSEVRRERRMAVRGRPGQAAKERTV